MEIVVALLGALAALVSHDLAAQGLTDTEPLRPLTGTCPRCLHRRGWTHRICPECGRGFRRELAVVLVGSGVAVGFANTVGTGALLVPYGLFLLLSMALLLTDLDEFRIVNRLNLRGTLILGVVFAAVALINGETTELVRGLLGAAAYFGGSLILYLLVRGRGFGGGDVKLAPQLGLFTAFLSWGTLGWAVFVTAMIGGLMAMVMVVFGSAGRDSELPYGPPMILGAWTAIILAGMGVFPLPT